MTNTFMSEVKNMNNQTITWNGAKAYSSTLNAVYDMFAMGAAMRQVSDEDCILQFKKAYKENAELALKCLFYIADVRSGQGERRYFRLCYRWLCREDPKTAIKFLAAIPFYTRWDNLIYITLDYPIVFAEAMKIITNQLELDKTSKSPSLLGKWLPSLNASSKTTKAAAAKVSKALGMTPRDYRKMLTSLRNKINIVETLMSEGRWSEIDFGGIPSKAGMIYRNAFAKHDLERYKEFIESKNNKVNASTLYPYDIVRKARTGANYGWIDYNISMPQLERDTLQKYWDSLPDYFDGKFASMMCVIDTSGSMTCGMGNVAPIDVAISLGLYAAERNMGEFANHFISFSSTPQFVETKGVDLVDKVARIYSRNECSNTNLESTFELLLDIAIRPNVRPEDIPSTLVIISDMQIDCATTHYHNYSTSRFESDMDEIAKDWEVKGIPFPKIVYWNVNAANPTILQRPNSRVSYVSGCSPVIFKQIITGVSGIEIMMQTLLSERYNQIAL